MRAVILGLLLTLSTLALLPGTAVAVAVSATITDYAFGPASIEVEAGDTVTWTNGGAENHTVRATGGQFSSGLLTPGASFSRTFLNEGSFPVVCDLHPNMTGVVIVRAKAAPQQDPTNNGSNNNNNTGNPNPNRPNAPTVSVTSTGLQFTLSGRIGIQGTASDPHNRPVTVEVKVDSGPWLPATGGSTWSFTWDTTTVSDGNHMIAFRAFNGAEHSDILERSVSVRNSASRPIGGGGGGGDGGSNLNVPDALAGVAVLALAAVALALRRRA